MENKTFLSRLNVAVLAGLLSSTLIMVAPPAARAQVPVQAERAPLRFLEEFAIKVYDRGDRRPWSSTAS